MTVKKDDIHGAYMTQEETRNAQKLFVS